MRKIDPRQVYEALAAAYFNQAWYPFVDRMKSLTISAETCHEVVTLKVEKRS